MNPAIQPLRFLMQWVLKQWFHCRTNTEVLEQPGMPPQVTDWNYDKKTFRAPESFFSRGLNAPLIFYFFHSDGNKKTFWSPKSFFFTHYTCFESNFCPPRFLNLINSPRLNCKDSPRTSSALALNYADRWCSWVGRKIGGAFQKPVAFSKGWMPSHGKRPPNVSVLFRGCGFEICEVIRWIYPPKIANISQIRVEIQGPQLQELRHVSCFWVNGPKKLQYIPQEIQENAGTEWTC